MCFPVKFAKLLRTPISKNICKRLLLPFVGFTKLYHNIFLWFSLSFIKRHEWYIECQWMTTSGTTNDNEWYNEWYNEWQRVTASDITNDNKWQQMAMSETEWQQWYNKWKRHSTFQRMDDCHPFSDKNRYTTTSRDGWLRLEWLDKQT